MINKRISPDTMHSEDESIDKTQTIMRLHLEAMVPLAIADLAKMGGATDWHHERIREYAWDIAGSEALLFREKGKTAKMLSKLVEGLAVMAFQPGGVTFLGLHFEASVTKEGNHD